MNRTGKRPPLKRIQCARIERILPFQSPSPYVSKSRCSWHIDSSSQVAWPLFFFFFFCFPFPLDNEGVCARVDSWKRGTYRISAGVPAAYVHVGQRTPTGRRSGHDVNITVGWGRTAWSSYRGRRLLFHILLPRTNAPETMSPNHLRQ